MTFDVGAVDRPAASIVASMTMELNER